MRRVFLLWLFFSVFISALDISLVGPLLPLWRDLFGVPTARVQLLVSLFVLGIVFGGLLGPGLTGRFRPSDILMGGLALFGVGDLMVAFAPRFEWLLLGRFLQGIGAGSVFPLGATLVYFIFPAHQRGRVLGLLGSVFGLSFLIGPPAAGLLIPVSWRLLFMLLALLILPLFLFYRKHRAVLPLPLNKPVDGPGIALMSAAMVLMAAWLVWQSYRPDDYIGLTVLGLLTALCLIWWGIRQLKTPSPLVALRPLRTSPIRETAMIAFLAGFIEASVVFVPAFLVDVFKVDYHHAAFMLVPIVVAMALAAPLSGWLTDKKSPAVALILAGILLAGAFWGIAHLPLTVTNFYLVGVLIGTGLAFLLAAPIRYILLQYAPLPLKDVLQGNITLYMHLGHLMGTVFMGRTVVKGLTDTYLKGFMGMVLPSLAVLVLALLIAWVVRSTPPPAAQKST